jgi:hypothetical protein
MMLRAWTLAISSVLLLSGCATKIADPLCSVVEPIYFDTDKTVDWLAANDTMMLRQVVAQNEVIQSTCQ